MSDNGVHRCNGIVAWSGSTGAGYANYDRSHQGWAPPCAARLSLSADAAFRGDPTKLNPEQLLVLAAASCQLLSFIAVAARAHVDVLDYRDECIGLMPEKDPPMRVTEITLRPRIRVRGASEETVRALVKQAHDECFIANSLRSKVVLEPSIEVVGSGAAAPDGTQAAQPAM